MFLWRLKNAISLQVKELVLMKYRHRVQLFKSPDRRDWDKCLDCGLPGQHRRKDTVKKMLEWEAFKKDMKHSGHTRPELCVGEYDFKQFTLKYAAAPPSFSQSGDALVMKRGDQIIVRPGGFVLWSTEEKVGTTEANADLICFVEGKSTKARTGMVVHLTAPNIHSTWWGNIVLEIVNLGPFDLVFHAGDAVAQLTACKISSPPFKSTEGGFLTVGQTGVSPNP